MTMRKYEKPVLARRELLSAVTAVAGSGGGGMPINGPGPGNGGQIGNGGIVG